MLKRSSDKLRNRGARFSAGVEAFLHFRDDDIECRAHNISRTGALLTGVLPAAVDVWVEVTFRLPQGGIETRLPGRLIRRGEEDEDGERELAFEFGSLEAKHGDDLEILVSRVVEGSRPAPIEALKPGMAPHEIREALELVPLAHRISLALRANPREREFLLHDSRPQVLEAISRNPSLLIQQARELASNRTVLATTLELLAKDPRWADDEELQIRVVTHPRVPLPLAGKMIEAMGSATLRKVMQRPGLHPSLRRRLIEQMVRKAG